MCSCAHCYCACTLLQVYTFGNGSGVGKGVTDPKQLTPWLVEGISSEIIVDIATGDGHCLALTQSMPLSFRLFVSEELWKILYLNFLCW